MLYLPSPKQVSCQEAECSREHSLHLKTSTFKLNTRVRPPQYIPVSVITQLKPNPHLMFHLAHIHSISTKRLAQEVLPAHGAGALQPHGHLQVAQGRGAATTAGHRHWASLEQTGGGCRRSLPILALLGEKRPPGPAQSTCQHLDRLVQVTQLHLALLNLALSN